MNSNYFKNLSRKQKLVIGAAITATLILIAVFALVMAVLNRSTTDNVASQPVISTVVSQPTATGSTFVQIVNSRDFDRIYSTLATNITPYNVMSGSQQPRDAVNELVNYLKSHSGNFQETQLTQIDVSGDFYFHDGYQALVSPVGPQSWIGYRYNTLGLIDGLVLDLDDKYTGSTSSVISQPNSGAASLDMKWVTLGGGSTTGNYFYGVAEANETIVAGYQIQSNALLGSVCKLTTYQMNANGSKQQVAYVELTLTEVNQVGSVDPRLKVGNYTVELNCNKDGKAYSKAMTAEIVLTPSSACDTKQFGFEKATKTFTEATTNIVGTWRGCIKYSSMKPYEVEIIFKADGTYSARNIEKVKYPNTKRDHAAMYYGLDNTVLKYELRNQLTNGDVEGMLQLFDHKQDKIQTVRFNANNSKMTFEVMNGEYGPLMYEMERAN